MNAIYDKILSKFHKIADDEKITDGWQAFSDMWDWIENEAAQSEQRIMEVSCPECEFRFDAVSAYNKPCKYCGTTDGKHALDCWVAHNMISEQRASGTCCAECGSEYIELGAKVITCALCHSTARR